MYQPVETQQSPPPDAEVGRERVVWLADKGALVAKGELVIAIVDGRSRILMGVTAMLLLVVGCLLAPAVEFADWPFTRGAIYASFLCTTGAAIGALFGGGAGPQGRYKITQAAEVMLAGAMVSLLIAATPLLINQGSPPAMTSAQFALPPLCLALIGMVVAFLYRCAFPFELIEPWTDWLPP